MASPKDYSAFVPFDLYDFFGYLFPGTMFAGSLTIFLWHIHPDTFSKLWPQTGQSVSPAEVPFLLGLAIVVLAIITLYTVGHFVATLSHILIDRVLVDGIEGYPFSFLLKIPTRSRPYSEATFKYLFALFNLSLLVPVLYSDMTKAMKWLDWSLLLISLLILQRILIMVIHMFQNGRAFTARMGNKPVIKLFLLPDKILLSPSIEFSRKLLALDRRFPDAFISQYKEKFRSTFQQMNPDEVGSENYWLSAFHVLAANDTHQRMLDTWLQLYGFARNTAAAFYFSASLMVAHLYCNPQAHDQFTRIFLLTLLALAAALGIRYWILYSHYYSKGVFRAFLVSRSQ